MAEHGAGFQAATDAIVAHGCPICGDEPTFYFIDGPQGISLSPCGHTVTPMDAIEMARVQDEIDASELHEDGSDYG